MNERLERPLVTFALLSFNQEAFIRDAVQAALAQDYEPLEILISDDCSSDNTFEIASSIVEGYDGNHQVRLIKNANNLGIAGNVNSVFALAKGEYIVLGAGDDISAISRVSRIMSEASRGDISLLHSRVTKITVAGDVLGDYVPPLIELNIDSRSALLGLAGYIGASGAVKRTLFEKFGPIKYMSAYEDLVFLSRAIMSGEKVMYIDESLVKYRVGSGVTSIPAISVDGLSVFIEKRVLSILAHADVFRQRLADAEKSCIVPECSEVMDKIHGRVDVQLARYLCHADRLALLHFLLKYPVATMSGIWQEVWYFADILVNHFLRALRR